MKGKALGFLAVAATLVLATGALAAVIDGTPGDDRLRGIDERRRDQREGRERLRRTPSRATT